MAKQKTGGSPRVTGKCKAEQLGPESESEESVAGSVDSRATTTCGAPGSRRSTCTAASDMPSASSTPSKPKPKPRKQPNTGAAAESGTPAASPTTPKVGPPRGLKRTDALPSIPGASSSSNPAAPPAASIKVKLPAKHVATSPTGTITIPCAPAKAKRAPLKPLDPSRSFLRRAIPSDRDAFPPSFVLQGANDEAIHFEIDVVPGTVTARLVRGHRSNEELKEFYAASIDSSKTNRAIPVADFAGDWRSSEMGMIVDGALEADSAAAAYDAVRFRLECLEEFLALYPAVNPYSVQPLSFDDPSFDDPNDPKPVRVAHPYNLPVPKFNPARSDANVSADAQNFQVEASEYVAWWSAEGARLERTFLADLAAWTARRQAWVDRATKRISLRAEQVRTYIDRCNFTISRHLSIIRSLGEYGYILSVGPEHFFSERAPRRAPPSPLPTDFSQPSAVPASLKGSPRRVAAPQRQHRRCHSVNHLFIATPHPPSPCIPARSPVSTPFPRIRSISSMTSKPPRVTLLATSWTTPRPLIRARGATLAEGENEPGESEPEVVPSSVLGEEELPPRAAKVAGMKKSSKSKRSKPKTKADIVLELPADPESRHCPSSLFPMTASSTNASLYTSDNVPRGLTPYNGGGYTLSTRPGLEHYIAGLEDAGISPSMVGPVAYVTRGKGCSECWTPGWWCLRPRQGYEINAKCIRCLALRKACSQLDGYNFQVVDRCSLELNLKLFVEVLITHGWVFTQVLKQNTFELMLRAVLQVRRYSPPSDAKEKPATVPLVLDGTPKEIHEVVKAETLEVLPAFLLGIDAMRPASSSQEACALSSPAYSTPWMTLVTSFAAKLTTWIGRLWLRTRRTRVGRAAVDPGLGSAGKDGDADVTMGGGEVNGLLEATSAGSPSRICSATSTSGASGRCLGRPQQLSHGFGRPRRRLARRRGSSSELLLLLGGSASGRDRRSPQAPPSVLACAQVVAASKSSVPPP
ncbi:hypothetical protein DFH09DRAFT_1117376 [Mycena vulgaris]|nr:hypothetical protein DFH09DRAFT_1117376 [Mycena vulgaris]